MSSTYTSPNAPFSRNQERVFEAISDDARHTWRVLHAVPFLATGRIHDAHDRIWHVKSTRTPGVIWVVELKTGQCRNLKTGAVCPDRQFNHKSLCCHAKAATAAELNFVRDNHDNRLLFPDRRPMLAA